MFNHNFSDRHFFPILFFFAFVIKSDAQDLFFTCLSVMLHSMYVSSCN